MKAVSTVETASVVEPKTSVSILVHSISRMRPEAPDRKKQARMTARIGAGLYTSGARTRMHCRIRQSAAERLALPVAD